MLGSFIVWITSSITFLGASRACIKACTVRTWYHIIFRTVLTSHANRLYKILQIEFKSKVFLKKTPLLVKTRSFRIRLFCFFPYTKFSTHRKKIKRGCLMVNTSCTFLQVTFQSGTKCQPLRQRRLKASFTDVEVQKLRQGNLEVET